MFSIFFELFLIFYNTKPIFGNSQNLKLKNDAIAAFRNKKYLDSEKHLKLLSDLNIEDNEILANLGVCLYKQQKYNEAGKVFSKIENSTDIKVATLAAQQLGMIAIHAKDTANAIKYFENSLIKDSKNEISKYNLAFLKKVFLNSKPIKSVQNQPKDSTLDVNYKNLLDQNSKKTELLARLTKINMTEKQAKNIFDAIAQNEKKFIQQKKTKNDKKNDLFKSW